MSRERTKTQRDRARKLRLQGEAEVRGHERVHPEGVYDAIAAVNLYVEAFLAGAKCADELREARR